MSLPVSFLNVFAERPLTGNALAVVAGADGVADEVMAALARETRLSETTFVQSATEDGADYRNRIFTPFEELPFAGHPSLGTAVAVARWEGQERASFTQQTGAGLQPLEAERAEPGRWRASMVQGPVERGPEVDPRAALEAVGLAADDAHPELPAQVVSTGIAQLIVPVRSDDAVGRAAPAPAALAPVIRGHDVLCVYVSHHEVGSGEAHARAFFGDPSMPEDPATGSAAGPLCAYLADRAGAGALRIRQGAEMGHPSLIEAEPVEGGVRVSGIVLPLIDGEVRLPGA